MSLLPLLAALPVVGNLETSATISTRPAECRQREALTWEVARAPLRQSYCQSLARGNARLSDSPALARVDAERAIGLEPGRAAPRVLLARVLLRQGDASASHAAFSEALAMDPRSLDAPTVLREAADAARRAGAHDVAHSLYRRVVPLAEHLADRRERVRVLLEAGHVEMTTRRASGGTSSLDEALGLLRSASTIAQGRERLDVALSLALCLDRAGRMDLANALLTSTPGLSRWADSPAYAVAAEDRLALRALALEKSNPAESRMLLADLLSRVAPGAWRDVLVTRLARLASTKPRAPGKPR